MGTAKSQDSEKGEIFASAAVHSNWRPLETTLGSWEGIHLFLQQMGSCCISTFQAKGISQKTFLQTLNYICCSFILEKVFHEGPDSHSYTKLIHLLDWKVDSAASLKAKIHFSFLAMKNATVRASSCDWWVLRLFVNTVLSNIDESRGHSFKRCVCVLSEADSK